MPLFLHFTLLRRHSFIIHLVSCIFHFFRGIQIPLFTGYCTIFRISMALQSFLFLCFAGQLGLHCGIDIRDTSVGKRQKDVLWTISFLLWFLWHTMRKQSTDCYIHVHSFWRCADWFPYFSFFSLSFLMRCLPCDCNQWILVFIKILIIIDPLFLMLVPFCIHSKSALTAVALRNRPYLIATSPDRPACDSSIDW